MLQDAIDNLERTARWVESQAILLIESPGRAVPLVPGTQLRRPESRDTRISIGSQLNNGHEGVQPTGPSPFRALHDFRRGGCCGLHFPTGVTRHEAGDPLANFEFSFREPIDVLFGTSRAPDGGHSAAGEDAYAEALAFLERG